MKTSPAIRIITLLTACLMLLPLLASAESGMQVAPMGEFSGYLFQYWLFEPNVSFYLPLGLRTELVVNHADNKVLSMQPQDLPDHDYGLFAFQPGLAQKPMEKMTHAELQEVLGCITTSPEQTTYTLENAFLPGVTVMRVQEVREDLYAEHLIGLSGEWLFNMMIRRFDGETVMAPETLSLQRSVLESILSTPTMLATFTLPDSGIHFTLPEPLRLIGSITEPDFLSFTFPDPRPGIVASSLSLIAQRDALYQGKTIETLEKRPLDVLMRHATVQGYDEGSVRTITDATGNPMLSFSSDFGGNGKAQHLLALKDGWALQLVSTPIGNDYSEWMLSLQPSIMQALLSGEPMDPVDLPLATQSQNAISTVQNRVYIPLDTAILAIRVPEGYGVDILEDSQDSRQLALYHKLDDSKHYMVTAKYSDIERNASWANYYDESEKQQIGDQLAASITEISGSPTAYVEVAAGPMEEPCIYLENESKSCAEYLTFKDGYILSFDFYSSKEPFSEAEGDRLLSMFSLITGKPQE